MQQTTNSYNNQIIYEQWSRSYTHKTESSDSPNVIITRTRDTKEVPRRK